jgi:coatomer subunit delta
MIKVSKMESAKDQASDAAKVIQERRREAQKLGLAMQGIGSDSNAGGPNSSRGSNSNLNSLGSPSSQSNNYGEWISPPLSSPPPHSSGSDSPMANYAAEPSPSVRKPVSAAAAAPVKGMSLMSKNSKNKSLEDALVKEDKLAPVITSAASAKAQSAATHASSGLDGGHSAQVVQQPVMLAIVEKLCARVTRDGIVESYEIKGSLTLTANNDESGLCSVQMRLGANISQFAFNTHPKVNKALYDRNGLIQLKDTTKGFPSSRPVGILKWNYSNTSDELLPFKINCWPEEESRNRMIVTIEYTMDNPALTLHDVEVKIPLGTSEPLTIANIDGTYKHSPSAAEVVWQIPMIDSSNASGSFEFTVAQRQADAFFPITVNFSSSQLLCELDVVTVTNPNSSAPLQYGLTKLMSTEEYVIE